MTNNHVGDGGDARQCVGQGGTVSGLGAQTDWEAGLVVYFLYYIHSNNSLIPFLVLNYVLLAALLASSAATTANDSTGETR